MCKRQIILLTFLGGAAPPHQHKEYKNVKWGVNIINVNKNKKK